jgi:hypothetical protein
MNFVVTAPMVSHNTAGMSHHAHTQEQADVHVDINQLPAKRRQLFEQLASLQVQQHANVYKYCDVYYNAVGGFVYDRIEHIHDKERARAEQEGAADESTTLVEKASDDLKKAKKKKKKKPTSTSAVDEATAAAAAPAAASPSPVVPVRCPRSCSQQFVCFRISLQMQYHPRALTMNFVAHC